MTLIKLILNETGSQKNTAFDDFTNAQPSSSPSPSPSPYSFYQQEEKKQSKAPDENQEKKKEGTSRK